MIYRNFGTAEFNVPVLGFGAGQIGDMSYSDKECSVLLNTAADLGINLFDTARGYYVSEERIGRHLASRRNEIILSTKVGYGIEGYSDWTYECIIAGVDEALKILRTDYIDIVHLHSCPLETLQRGEVISALEKSRADGKILCAAYSGENEALAFAVDSGRFQSIMTSVNPADQAAIDSSIADARNKTMGVIAKRPAANALWRFSERPYGDYSEEYWLRWKAMELHFNMPEEELFLRFTAYAPGIDCCIAGTKNINHLKKNYSIVMKGPLPPDIYNTIRKAFAEKGEGWRGLT